MPKRIRDLYDKHVYTTGGKLLGIAVDFIIDTDERRLVEIEIQPEDEPETFKVPFSSVIGCEDVFIVKSEEELV
ncbi:MAG: hypothetical protein DRN96_09560 [Thermoproteota archaeon]|nr:MAG: hypothetical protein DRN96_09560 [Candidatus Korarchaeota archaeon]RLG55904.1 MAG: hypothetical protein DRN99_01315 [Candidatus Korarchaeota archaeon]